MTTATATEVEVIAKTIVSKPVLAAMRRIRLTINGKRHLIERMQNRVRNSVPVEDSYAQRKKQEKAAREIMTTIARAAVPVKVRNLAAKELFAPYLRMESFRTIYLPAGTLKVEIFRHDSHDSGHRWFGDFLIVHEDGSAQFRAHATENLPTAHGNCEQIVWENLHNTLQYQLLRFLQGIIDETADYSKPLRAIGKTIKQAYSLADLYLSWPELAQEYCVCTGKTLPTEDNIATTVRTKGTQMSTLEAVPPDLLREAAKLLGMSCSIPVSTPIEKRA